MKRNVAKWVILLGAAVLVIGSARAGMRAADPVTLGGGWASGNLGQARASDNYNEAIGCYLFSYTDFVYIDCIGRDGAGNSLTCFSSNPNFIAAVQASAGDSYIAFHVDDNGGCDMMQVTNSSVFAPKEP